MNIKSIINGENPILDKFKDIAPGTDRHCLNVSILCESISKVMNDIDSDLLIAAARIHDIGKCINPSYFSENQESDNNIHDGLDPQISYQYISRHISDGVLKLIQLDFDPIIIKIVSEHHGNTVVNGIYNKAKKKYNGSTMEEHYRYKSTKPTMIESCVLMISDVVESACRSLSSSGKLENIKNTIERLINELIDDEQLDVLTIGHIRLIKKILLKDIESIYHKRVDYEQEDEE
jgi:putative nucleotidyltransferase with HDIG domain